MIIRTANRPFFVNNDFSYDYQPMYCDTETGKLLYYFENKWWYKDKLPTANNGYETTLHKYNNKFYFQHPDTKLYFWLQTKNSNDWYTGRVIGLPESERGDFLWDKMEGSSCEDLCGVYSDGERIGCLWHKDQNDVDYIQSVELDDNGHYTYGSIHHDGQGWIIGSRNSGAWWTGNEPIEGAFSFTKKGTATENMNFTFVEYTFGKIQMPTTNFNVWLQDGYL